MLERRPIFHGLRKPLDKILELGKETGWVIAYEPDTKEKRIMNLSTWKSGSWCWRWCWCCFFPPIKLFQLTFEFPTTCFAGQTLLHLGKLRVPCRDVANPTGLQHSLNSCIRLHRVAIVATVAKDCMHSAPTTDHEVDSLLEESRQRPLMAAIDGSRVVASTRWTDLVSDLRQTFDHKRNHIDVAVSAKGFQPMNLDRFAYKGSLGVPCSIRWRIHQG